MFKIYKKTIFLVKLREKIKIINFQHIFYSISSMKLVNYEFLHRSSYNIPKFTNPVFRVLVENLFE